jgi:hypothetical protein
MNVIEAPAPFHDAPHPWLFTGGVIEQGKAVDWQTELALILNPFGGTLLNPRRRDWDSTWQQTVRDVRFKQQVDWELDAQALSDVLVYYLDAASKAPITLLEIGLHVYRKPLVYCHPDFWRRGNLEVLCARGLIRLTDEYATWLDGIRDILAAKGPPAP